MDSFRYFAFISYSHVDKLAAKKLYRRLNNYRLPKSVKDEYIKKEGRRLPDRISPIFIDNEEMANSSVLEGMRAGLERSRFLIVVCSPNSAESNYVNSEVEYFIRIGRGDYIIPYIINGKPCSGDPETECFPKTMRERDRYGPDVQELKENAALQVIAMMLNVDMHVLAQRDKQRRERMIISAATFFVVIALAFGFYNNHMRSRIEDENRKYRISLSNQFLQAGENAEEDGNISEAMMYYAKSLQMQPSNKNAKMNALIGLQSSGWLTVVDDGDELDDDTFPEYVGPYDLLSLIGTVKFGYLNYSVYREDLMITLVPEDGGTVYRAEIPEKYRSEFLQGYYDGSYESIYAALVKRDEKVRLILAKDHRALVYSFENQKDLGKRGYTGTLIYSVDLKKLEDRYLDGETADVNGVYGSDYSGQALFSLGILKETPILFDVFEGKVICALDMGEDFKVTYAAFEKNGKGIAILSKIYPQSASTNTRIRYYDENGDLRLATSEVDGLNLLRNIDYSPDGKALILCRNDALFIFSTENNELLCPKLRADYEFVRANFSPSGSMRVVYADMTGAEYKLQCFEPIKKYVADHSENLAERIDNSSAFAINDDLYIVNNDPDIDLINRNRELLDKAEEIMYLPYKMNDGRLWWGECTGDREASIAFVYGYLEVVFYRVRYDEELSKIIKAEPIVLKGRNTKELVAFDNMCAVRTTDDYLLGYRNDAMEPFYAIDIHGTGRVISMKWLGDNVVAIVFENQSEDIPGSIYSLELWNVSTGKRISQLERNSESSITELKISDGVFSYWKGEHFRYWILEAEDPDQTAIQFLANLSLYRQDDNGMSKFTTPVFTGNMGNWGDIFKCIGSE